MWIRRGLQDAGEAFVVAPLEHACTNQALGNCEDDRRKQRQREDNDDGFAHRFTNAWRCFGFPADVEFVGLVHVAMSISAGSARVPAEFGLGCTYTRPFFTRTLNVGTFSANGGGDAPVSGWY